MVSSLVHVYVATLIFREELGQMTFPGRLIFPALILVQHMR